MVGRGDRERKKDRKSKKAERERTKDEKFINRWKEKEY
jgi:hypothetical protein